MSQARWKYWIGEDDGKVHIRQADLPPGIIGDPALTEDGLGINLNLMSNPELYEFWAEVIRVSGKKEIVIHQPGDPEPPEGDIYR